MAATTTLLGLVTPTQGTLSGTWGDTVNYGISDYVDIAIAGTLSFSGDGAITLANTTGSASGNAITTTTAQYMVIRVTGTLTTPKIITGPSYSKLYMVDNSATGSTVSFIRAGQVTAVSVAVGEKCFVYYNGTDYVKVASSVADGVTTIDFGSTGLTPATATSGAVTVAGTLAVANGGTGLTAGTSGGVPYYSGTGTIASSAALAAASLVVGGGAGAAPATTTTGTGVVTALGTNVGTAGAFVVNGGALGTPSSGTLTNATGLPIGTGVSGLGTNVATALAVNIGSAGAPVVNGGVLGTPSSGTATNLTGLPLSTGVTGTLPILNGGTGQTTASAAFNALSPITTAGDLILGDGTNSATRLPIGANTYVLTSNGSTASWASPATSGTVTAVSVVSANGLAGTSSGGATPALTLSTSITGVLKGNGTAISAATAGTDYVTPTGTETLTNKTIEAGTFTNGYTEEVATANTSTAYTIDLANGSVQILTLTGNCVYTFPTPVAGKSFILVQLQDATGSRTVTWPATVDWPSATAPTLTATALRADKFVFTAISGTSWLGSVAGQNYTV